MTSRLHEQQSQLLATLVSQSASSAPNFIALNAGFMRANGDFSSKNVAHRGWLAYRSHATALAQRALAGAYPGTARLLGEPIFGHLARSLWFAHAPTCGDLAQWGERLCDYILTSENWRDLLIDYPALPAMMQVEWALHRCAALADAPTDQASWALLASHEPSQLRLLLAPGTQLFFAAHALAHLLLEAGLPPCAPHRLSDDIALLVWRQGFKPCWRSLQPSHAALVQALLSGASLTQALDEVQGRFADFDFQHWLLDAGRSGLLIAVRPINTT